jgi:hypothetical protein
MFIVATWGYFICGTTTTHSSFAASLAMSCVKFGLDEK